MAPFGEKRLLTTTEAASYCGSAKSTFEKLRLSGESAFYIKLGRKVVYDPADLDRWLIEKRRSSTSDDRAGRSAGPRVEVTRSSPKQPSAR
jgi:excisionase family DNA binding protein